MEDNLIDKISKLENEDLAFYKKLINFFAFLGVTSEDLVNLTKIVRNFPEFITKINSVLNDQKIINDKYNKIINSQKDSKGDRPLNPFDDLNKERETLNIYGR